MLHALAPLMTVASIWVVAVLTPGPNFLLSARISAAQSRAHGLAVVCGIGAATAIWGLAGLTGVQALFVAAPWLYLSLKLAGAAYLVVTGARLILRRAEASRPADAPPRRRLSGQAAFRIGLVTCLANPRSALSVASIFAVALPMHPAPALGGLAVALMVVISVSWYSGVVYLFATGSLAAAYQRLSRWIDRLAGALLIGFGARLALEPG